MTDEEYREFLSALARKHLKVQSWRSHFGKLGPEDELRHEIDRLASTARFVRVAEERVDEQELLNVLAEELGNRYFHTFDHAMESSGVLMALDGGTGHHLPRVAALGDS